MRYRGGDLHVYADTSLLYGAHEVVAIDHDSAADHAPHAASVADVIRRISVENDYVSEKSWSDPPDLNCAHDARGIRCCGCNRVERFERCLNKRFELVLQTVGTFEVRPRAQNDASSM